MKPSNVVVVSCLHVLEMLLQLGEEVPAVCVLREGGESTLNQHVACLQVACLLCQTEKQHKCDKSVSKF